MKNKRLMSFLPTEYKKDIFSIDYNSLLQNGIKTLLFDLDNTIADYGTSTPNDETINLFKNIKELGFDIYLISNNFYKRLSVFINAFNSKGMSRIHKPFTFKIRKLIKKNNIDSSVSYWIGDQAVTDIRCANKLNFRTILVDPINKDSEKWYTKLNRKREKLIYKKLSKKEIFLQLGLDKRC